MKKIKKIWRKFSNRRAGSKQERGSALVIVTLVLSLLTIYVSTSLTISTTDAISSNFEVAQRRAFYTSYAKLEQMTNDFSALFASSLSPSYDSMCRVVLSDPLALNQFRLITPNVSCPPGSACSPSYTEKFIAGTNIFDLGWVGDPKPFCVVDVCNPNAAPLCNFPPRPPVQAQINRGEFAGLQGFIRRYRMSATAVSENRGGSDVQITRDFDNILLPLFQFGIFSDSDFELYIPPNWAFGGWVHTNGDFYITGDDNSFSRFVLNASDDLVRIPAQITVSRHIVIGTDKMGRRGPNGGRAPENILSVFNGATFDTITTGSARNGALVNSCKGIIPNSEAPPGACDSFNGLGGNVKIGVPKLRLPIQSALNANPIELIKRGINSDDGTPLIDARYYYRPGIRVTLTDYQNQLPRTVLSGDSPAQPTGPYGGIQLDGPDPILGSTVPSSSTDTSLVQDRGSNWYYKQDDDGKFWPIPRGYQPKAQNRPTGARINGNRIHGWIKVELVTLDAGGRVITYDITQEMLNLGVTVPYKADRGAGFYYPRAVAGFPSFPFPDTGPGPYPDENSVIHLQRFAASYHAQLPPGANPPGALPAFPNRLDATLSPNLDDVSTAVDFDYYASMALRNFDNKSLVMYGIADDADTRTGITPTPPPYTSRFSGTNTPYSEPQPDNGGYLTHTGENQYVSFSGNVLLPTSTPIESKIDFTGLMNPTRAGAALSENINLPKTKASVDADPRNGVLNPDGETTWMVGNDCLSATKANCRRLVPFPINMYDSREGVPHEDTSSSSVNSDPPVPGLTRTSTTKNGVINLIEIDMGNLGRLLKGDFDNLFAVMGNTPYRTSTGTSLRGGTLGNLFTNISARQDNGWLIYVSDRRGDEPMVQANPNILPGSPAVPVPNTPSTIGDGRYNREDVVWNRGGNTNAGNPAAIPARIGASFGCTSPGVSDNRDQGKSPQDANNDCFIQAEGINGPSGDRGYSETARYQDFFNSDQINSSLTYSDITGTGTPRVGNLIAMTEVASNPKQGWSHKPPVQVAAAPRVEMFRKGVRLVNASNLFPTGPVANPSCNTATSPAYLGVTVSTENPVYVFGNYNAPCGRGIDDGDPYPGIAVTPVVGGATSLPTSPGDYIGHNLRTCGTNCHVPAAVVGDAVTLLSGPNVGTSNTNWGGANGFGGWMDTRSFIMPYQALRYRTARNTVYRFAMVSGFTPSWFSGFWGDPDSNQGGTSQQSSGALNNFPRFLEDWGKNGNGNDFCTYSGSLIRIYKSQQANGAFKRVSNAGVAWSNAGGGSPVDYVYRPPNRDWVFDIDFNAPCLLPPGSPFLQLIDFKGFQQSQVQQK